MTYYEEFGVSPDASVPEIRQAYKRLVRLLHPDKQPDEELRTAAEIQMRRLNEMLEILLDPNRRRAYDSARDIGCGRHSFAASPRNARRLFLRYGLWMLLALLLCGSGAWYRKTGELARMQPAARSSVGNVPVTGFAFAQPLRRRPIQPTRRRNTQPTGEVKDREPNLGELAVPRQPPAAPAAFTAATAGDMREVNRTPESAVRTLEKADSPAEPNPFAGSWLYAPQSPSPGDAGLYPPDYIEFLLTENNERLVGQYRARYKVSDAALSPYVTFRVEGEAVTGKIVKLRWTGAQGAKGEIELTLRTADTMKVTWWTTRFGRGALLSSGTGLLVRQKGQP